MLVPGVPGNPGHYPFSGMELLRSRRKWELCSCQHCCHFASQLLVREMPVQRLIDESLLDAVTTRQRVGRGLLQRCGLLILQQQAAVTEHWSVTRLSHLQSKNTCCLTMADFVEIKTRESGSIFLEKGGQSAQCKLCKTKLKTVGGSTKGLHEHLKRVHDVTVLKRKIADMTSRQCV